MKTDTASLDPEIEQLRHDWNQLSSLERAQLVSILKKSGMSYREIGRVFDCAESSVRYVHKALDAPEADLAAARNNQISTAELVRRAKAAAERGKKDQVEARELDRKRKAKEASRTICEWLEQKHLGGSRGEAIAMEARSMLIANYTTGTLPRVDPQVVHPAADWIERWRPATSIPDDPSYISWYALWLARWSYCLCQHPEIAIDALAIAGKY